MTGRMPVYQQPDRQRKGSMQMKRLLMILLAIVFFTLPALAGDSTAYTYAISVEGRWTRTQDAYMPGAIFLRGAGLKSPEDMAVRGATIYVADSGNARVLACDLSSGESKEIGKGLFKKPTGLYVSDSGMVYVADFGGSAVYVFNAAHEQILKLTRPKSALFGKSSPYKPRKVLADAFGNIYVLGEGSYQGIMLFDKTGQFTGYFGSNRTSMSALEKLQELIFTQEQLARLFNRIPLTIYNAAPGYDGLIYSVTQNDGHNSVKAHSMAGTNVLTGQGKLRDETNFIDIAVSKQGQIYTITESGYIYEYDPDGNLIFSFGGQSLTTERSGLSTVAAAIDVDDRDVVYVLDKERGLVQAFYPTAYAAATHKALLSLSSGDYRDSAGQWEALLRQNGIARMAHEGLGRSQLLMGNYAAARQQFYLIQDQDDYSEAFWQIRNRWFTENFEWILIFAIIALCLFFALSLLNRRFRLLSPVKAGWKRLRSRPGLPRDLLFAAYMLRHPVDGFYELKKGRAGTVFSASLLCLFAFVIFLADTLFCGFLFRTADPRNTPLLSLVVLFAGALGLFIVGNTLVSSVGSGEGNLRRVFVMTAYSLSPYVVFMPVLLLLTYVLTLNEGFLIWMGSAVIGADCAVTLFLGIRETHNFSGREIWKNIFLTMFFMIMAVVAISIVYLLWGQIAGFVRMVASEVMYRVRG